MFTPIACVKILRAGWNTNALDGLYDSLLVNVRSRITALNSVGVSPGIYVVGHSRGGAFVSKAA